MSEYLGAAGDYGNRFPRYGAVAIALHWVLAAAIMGTFGLGMYMSDLPFSPAKLKYFSWHKWAGVTILTMTALRLGWRLAHHPPALPPRVLAAMPPWQRRAHRATHGALYALCFVVPLLGWAYSSAAGVPIVWLGVLPLPNLVPVDKDLADHVLKPLHRLGAWTLAAAVGLHVAAAIKHQFVDRDGLMARMWPGARKEST
jgi:cytochrome b561